MFYFKQILFLIVFGCFFQSGFSQVGINTTTPMSMLDVNGNLSVKVVNLIGNGSGTSGSAILIDDGVYLSINPTATDDKFQLPNPVLYPGRIYFIRNINNSVTAQLTTTTGLLFPKNSTTGSSNIFMFEGNLRTITVISDGVNWTYIN